MGTLSTLFLLFAAIIGTILVVFSPSREFVKRFEGRRQSYINERRKENVGLYIGIVVELIQTAIVEPFYILFAILNHVGNVEIAQVALLLFIINLFSGITIYVIQKPQRKGDWAYPLTNWPLHYVRVIIASVPTLYLWYLLLTVLGIGGSIALPAGLLSSPVVWGLAILLFLFTVASALFFQPQPSNNAQVKEPTEAERDQENLRFQEMRNPEQW